MIGELESQRERGAVLAIVTVVLVVLAGMVALTVDVGRWYWADRQAQATADAAALAGAQELPQDTATAATVARDYAAANGGDGATIDVSFSGAEIADDTITVEVSRDVSGIFARVLGFDSVTVHARASARALPLSSANSIAPIVVNDRNPDLQCYLAGGGESCYDGIPDTFELVNYHDPGTGDAGGQFGLLNLDGSATGTAATSMLTEWIVNGYPGTIEPGSYYGAPSAKYNSSQFVEAMESKYYANCGCELLFPIWSGPIEGSGSNAVFTIIGWVSFRLESFDPSGNTATITGQFTEIIWDGIPASSGSAPNYGTRTIQLVE
jgi:Flp pilus assembly protein TadG